MVAEGEHPVDLVAARREDVQVHRRDVVAEQAMFEPLRFAEAERVADRFERRHVRALVRGVGHDGASVERCRLGPAGPEVAAGGRTPAPVSTIEGEVAMSPAAAGDRGRPDPVRNARRGVSKVRGALAPVRPPEPHLWRRWRSAASGADMAAFHRGRRHSGSSCLRPAGDHLIQPWDRGWTERREEGDEAGGPTVHRPPPTPSPGRGPWRVPPHHGHAASGCH